jgi:catechol 2,3-dioxygenase-like lactoylglutathione lyase family enzyme
MLAHRLAGLIAAIACLGVHAAAWSQAPKEPTPPFITTGAFIGVSVHDLEASVAWYAEKFGLAVVARPPRVESSTAVILEGGGLMVELMKHDDAVPLKTAAPAITRNYLVHGIFKSGIIVADFAAAMTELKARGVQIAVGPVPATQGQRAYAIVRDNSGNFIQVFGAK